MGTVETRLLDKLVFGLTKSLSGVYFVGLTFDSLDKYNTTSQFGLPETQQIDKLVQGVPMRLF